MIVDCVNRTAPIVEGPTPYRMIRTTNVRNGRIDLSSCRFVDEPTYETWTRRAKVLNGDIVLTREAPIGEVGFVWNLGSVFLGQRIVQYRPDPAKISPRYLYYAFRSSELQHQFGSHEGSGSVVSHIRVADCHEFKVPLPPRKLQDSIVSLIGSIDDKIELNRRMSETLEAMAQAIFRDWFVDFGPTRRKLAGVTDPIEIMGGLVQNGPHAATLAALFPATLGDNGLPEGWEERPLEFMAKQHTNTVSPSSNPDEEFEHFSLPAFDSGQAPKREFGKTILSNKTLLPENAVLLSKLNPEIKRVWLTPSGTSQRQISSTEFLVFTSNNDSGRAYLYCLFSNDRFRELLTGMVTGTSKSHQRVSPKSLSQRFAIYATPIVHAALEDVAGPQLQKVLHNRAESETLAATRDLLLPKLMSGDISLRDAETIAEATT